MRKYVAYALIATGLFFAYRWYVEPSSNFMPRLLTAYDVCDYRIFIRRCLVEPTPYRPITIPAHDACYPPIAYCLVKCFPLTQGGETAYVAFLFIALLAGLVFFLLQRKRRHAFLCVGAILLTVAFASGPLRGNTTAWATAAVFVFLAWFDATEKWKRLVAAVALGFASSLKITPVVYGLLYLRGSLFNFRKWPLTEILVASFSFGLLLFFPFLFFGGVTEVGAWFQNALANSAHYSREADFGMVPHAFLFSFWFDHTLTEPELCMSVWLTNLFVILFCGASLFARRFYHALILLGVAIAFLCHHDYGLAYLLPAFAFWLGEEHPYCVGRFCNKQIVFAEAVLWFVFLQSVTCAFSEKLLYIGYVVYNSAITILGLISLIYVSISLFRSWRGH